MTMTLHNYRSRQFHRTLNGVNLSSGFKFRDMCSTKSGPHWCQFWQVLCPWASPYGANWQMSMTLHNFRSRQFHWALNSENPSSSFRDMHSAKSVSPAARPPGCTSMTIPLQPGGLKGNKKELELELELELNCKKKKELTPTLDKGNLSVKFRQKHSPVPL